jgi:hypothetical protein
MDNYVKSVDEELTTLLMEQIPFHSFGLQNFFVSNMFNVSTMTVYAKTNVDGKLPIGDIEARILDNNNDDGANVKVRTRSKRFRNCMVFEVREPKVVVKLFSNGGLHCTGAKTMRDAKIACDAVLVALQEEVETEDGKAIEVVDIHIQMINGSIHTGQPIDLEKAFDVFQRKHQLAVCLNRENHSALKIRYHSQAMQKATTVLIFTSGCVIFTGCSSPRDIWEAYGDIISKMDDEFPNIQYAGVYVSKKKDADAVPKKRGRKRKADTMQFYDDLLL